MALSVGWSLLGIPPPGDLGLADGQRAVGGPGPRRVAGGDHRRGHARGTARRSSSAGPRDTGRAGVTTSSWSPSRAKVAAKPLTRTDVTSSSEVEVEAGQVRGGRGQDRRGAGQHVGARRGSAAGCRSARRRSRRCRSPGSTGHRCRDRPVPAPPAGLPPARRRPRRTAAMATARTTLRIARAPSLDPTSCDAVSPLMSMATGRADAHRMPIAGSAVPAELRPAELVEERFGSDAADAIRAPFQMGDPGTLLGLATAALAEPTITL